MGGDAFRQLTGKIFRGNVGQLANVLSRSERQLFFDEGTAFSAMMVQMRTSRPGGPTGPITDRTWDQASAAYNEILKLFKEHRDPTISAQFTEVPYVSTEPEPTS